MSRKKGRAKRKRKRKAPGKKSVAVKVHPPSFFEVKLDKLPAGIAMNDCKAGDEVLIACCEFSSSEDGELFISRLEGFPSRLIRLVHEQHGAVLPEASISGMVATITRDRTARVYVNPTCTSMAQIRQPRDIAAGESLFKSDIADVQELRFPGITFPDDAGIIVIMSVGWRRGMFFDLRPLGPDPISRDYDLGVLLAGYHSYMMFRTMFDLSEDGWAHLVAQQWFPFISLKDETIRTIIQHAMRSEDVDVLLPQIREELDEHLPAKLENWATIPAYQPHMSFINQAHARYQEGDHISCLSILTPRIEGILRSFQGLTGESAKAGQRDLAEVVVSDAVNPKHPHYSPLLPARFNKYLEESFFAHFAPTDTDHALSRNTVGHGVAGAEAFNEKGSVIGFLVLAQLALYMAGVGASSIEGGKP